MIAARRLAPFVLAACLAAGVPRSLAARFGESTPGLPVETITTIFQDRTGFLWVGSREGLLRYDGHSSILFEHDASDPASISDNSIRTVYEDRRGDLWVGTNTGGLDHLDPASWTFTHYRHRSDDRASLCHDSVYAIVEDADGRFWIGTQKGLDRFDAASGRFEHFPAGLAGPPHDYIAALHLGGDGALWIATVGGGLGRRDPSTGRFDSFHHRPDDPLSLPHDNVFAIDEDARGGLWLATAVGAARFEPRTHECRLFPYPGRTGGDDVLTTSIGVDGEGTVWASTFASGLWSLRDPETVFRHQPFRTAWSADSSTTIFSLHPDKAGNVWVGTVGEGLGHTSRTEQFLRIVERPGRPPGSGLDEVSSVLEDSAGRVWIGDIKSGLGRLDPDGSARRYEIATSPLALREGRDGALWIGSAVGLLRLDPRSGALKRYIHDTGDPRTLGAGWVWTVLEDRSGRVWVGTGEAGLNRLGADGTFTRLINDPADPRSLSDNYVTCLLEDRRGTLWVGTRSGGLDVMEESRPGFTRYLPVPGDPTSLSHHSVSALLEDHEGGVWIGTAGGGLDHFERGAGDHGRFVRFTKTDGLIDDNVVSLLEDDDGTLWIGTRRGLSRFDPRSRTFANYGVEDGLPSAELNAGAAFAGKTSLLFGTHRGLVSIPRGTPLLRPSPSPTVVTSVRIPDDPARSEMPAGASRPVEIPYGRILSLEFAVLDYGDLRRHRYEYRLNENSDTWIDLGSRRDITFTDLDPGRYALRVRGRNGQGVWSEVVEPLRIHVIPPFWMTLWFRLSAVLVLVAALATGHRIRTASLTRRNRELTILKDEREKALDEAGASQRKLGDAYQRLRLLTRRLEAAKEDERRRIARELHDEMGQALTTAKLNLQLLSGPGAPDDRDRRIGDTIGLLDRMIGLVRALSIDLRPPLLDELGLAAALRGYTEALTRRSGLEIGLEVEKAPSALAADIEITAFRVVQEALTNVLRHAGARRVEIEVRYDERGLHLEIADDGRGFEPSSILGQAAGMKHIGLLGMLERVESMGGTLEIDSGPGRGTRIRSSLPLGG